MCRRRWPPGPLDGGELGAFGGQEGLGLVASGDGRADVGHVGASFGVEVAGELIDLAGQLLTVVIWCRSTRAASTSTVFIKCPKVTVWGV